MREKIVFGFMDAMAWCCDRLHSLSGGTNFDLARHINDLLWLPLIFLASSVFWYGHIIVDIASLLVCTTWVFEGRLNKKAIDAAEARYEQDMFPSKNDLDAFAQRCSIVALGITLHVLMGVALFMLSGWTGLLWSSCFVIRGLLTIMLQITLVDVGRENKDHVLSRVRDKFRVLKPAKQGI